METVDLSGIFKKDKKEYIRGLLLHVVKIRNLKPTLSPPLHELMLFLESKADKMATKDIASRLLKSDDRVKIIAGDFVGVIGIILNRNGPTITVDKGDFVNESDRYIIAMATQAEKYFVKGDQVKVFWGRLRFVEGIVVDYNEDDEKVMFFNGKENLTVWREFLVRHTPDISQQKHRKVSSDGIKFRKGPELTSPAGKRVIILDHKQWKGYMATVKNWARDDSNGVPQVLVELDANHNKEIVSAHEAVFLNGYSITGRNRGTKRFFETVLFNLKDVAPPPRREQTPPPEPFEEEEDNSAWNPNAAVPVARPIAEWLWRPEVTTRMAQYQISLLFKRDATYEQGEHDGRRGWTASHGESDEGGTSVKFTWRDKRGNIPTRPIDLKHFEVVRAVASKKGKNHLGMVIAGGKTGEIVEVWKFDGEDALVYIAGGNKKDNWREPRDKVCKVKLWGTNDDD
ncbi:hypothetical protein BD410DRAFT_846048 [Rickenella mellea]|uniref:KOW domain-containing protein n=1 Tax=Rickenella mellea TaxID=50990 RepID=A0A4Y7PG49_9AGAM|nr:hypothetical protein BD410DRAFT_846048 [Rickenella mellea]